jgi:GrpB-like predicted nucleotidyltransferase (UPF0157 family)
MQASENDVVICDYDPAWSDEFSRLRTRLANTLGNLALSIEHVGSTAVLGLAAKPIVDIDVVIATSRSLPEVKDRLASIGYTFEGDLGIDGRFAFAFPPSEKRHHLYVCESQNRELHRHIAFRDLLRREPELAAEYAKLKRRAAEQFRKDRSGYAAAKTAFVEKALASISQA